MNASPAKLISQTPHLSVDGSGRLRVEAVGETDAICPPRVDASAGEDPSARLAIAGPNQCNKAVSESVVQREVTLRAQRLSRTFGRSRPSSYRTNYRPATEPI